MHRVLIMSDSHRLKDEVVEIKNRHKNIDHVIHCGDSELAIDSPQLKGVTQVAGNCDFGEPFPSEEQIKVGNLSFFVTHGHLHGVKESLTSLSYYVADKDVDIILYGHNHIASAKKIKNQLFINPGSIRFPRNRVEKTYVVIEWDSAENIHINFYTVAGELVPDLQVKTSVEI